jgi:hypothetical protein
MLMNLETKGAPVIDPSVRYVGVSKLRELKADKLRSLDQTLVIQDDEKPLAVVLSYEQFLDMQNERDQILTTLESLLRKEGTDLLTAIQEANSGKTKPLTSIRKTLKERKSNNVTPER